jgi:hypothetical protein
VELSGKTMLRSEAADFWSVSVGQVLVVCGNIDLGKTRTSMRSCDIESWWKSCSEHADVLF